MGLIGCLYDGISGRIRVGVVGLGLGWAGRCRPRDVRPFDRGRVDEAAALRLPWVERWAERWGGGAGSRVGSVP